tara:strand:- start:177 stop:323 length:147 start_codon:yes stop_codon:yes gene_type:complete
LSKGSKDRTKDRDKFEENFDRIFQRKTKYPRRKRYPEKNIPSREKLRE